MTIKTNAPLPIKVETGLKYSWCSCGFSQAMPLCPIKNRLNLLPKKLEQYIYAVVQKHNLHPIVIIVIIAGEANGY
jgi:hypothetical protein